MLITRYRPERLDQIVGNQSVIASIESILSREVEKIPHTFMLVGLPGCGKTTIARIIAARLQCTGQDVHETNAANFTGIDNIRDIISQMKYKPMESDTKVWIMDECHKLSGPAQDSFLKALEEPPEHVYFILCTTDPQTMKKAVLRRCSIHELKPINEQQMMGYLETILIKEKKGGTVPLEILEQITTDSGGQPGVALGLLDKIIDLPAKDMKDALKQSISEKSQAIELCRALIKGASWKEIAEILKGIEEEPETVRRIVLGYCNTVLLSGNSKAFSIMNEFVDPFYNTGKPGLTWACYRAFMNK